MKTIAVIFLGTLVVLSLSACGTFELGVESTTTVVVAPTVVPTIVTVPTVTPGAPPPATVPPTALPPPTAPPAASPTPQEMSLQVFLIAVGDNGVSGKMIGCGDSAVPVQLEVPYTVGVLKASLGALFSIKERDYGESGLYNALYQSDLQVQKVTLQNRKATVYLTGTLQLGGECDTPRVKAQIEETALQFSTVDQVEVFLNGQPLDQALSLK